MRSFLLQDFTTIRGSGAVTSVKQPETGWLDLSAFSDVVFWLEVKEYVASATFYIYYETATLREDGAFVTLASLPMASGVSVTTVFKETAATPIAKWVRWRLANQSGALWDATFRILGAANAVGRMIPALRAEGSSAFKGGQRGTPSTPMHQLPPSRLRIVVPSTGQGPRFS